MPRRVKGLSLVLVAIALRLPALSPEAVVPVEREPRHHLVFASENIRVLDVELPPGYVSLFHEHARDNVPIAVRGGDLVIKSPGGESRAVTAPDGSVSFAAGGFVHQVTNAGEHPVHYVDVELLSPPPATAAAADPERAPLDSRHTLEIENPRLRLYRVRLDPGTELAQHRHPGAVVVVFLSPTRLAPWQASPSGVPTPTANNSPPAPAARAGRGATAETPSPILTQGSPRSPPSSTATVMATRTARAGEYRWLLRGNVPGARAGRNGAEWIEIELLPSALEHADSN